MPQNFDEECEPLDGIKRYRAVVIERDDTGERRDRICSCCYAPRTGGVRMYSGDQGAFDRDRVAHWAICNDCAARIGEAARNGSQNRRAGEKT